MIYVSTVIAGVIFLDLLYATLVTTYQTLESDNCDCGYNDPKYNTNWNELWHINFDEYNNIIDGNNQKLYSRKDFFFSNYVIPAKFNDSYPRVFRKENVFVQDNSLQIGITIENTTVLVNTNVTVPTNSSSNITSVQPVWEQQQRQEIRCGGLGTTRQDFLYGSFRSYMKTTKINGTVAGMFLYHPDGEIDIEILSSVKPQQAYFAIHPGLVEKNGKASFLTHGNQAFGFDPTEDFHEYRFDWYPGLAIFFVDGKEMYRSRTNVLSSPSRVMFNHWTDGNPKFSQGPAKENAFFSVKNMTFFFNSSDTLISSPKCITANRTCNIEKIVANLRDKNTTFESYLTTDEPTHHINPYDTNEISTATGLDLQTWSYTIIFLSLLIFYA